MYDPVRLPPTRRRKRAALAVSVVALAAIVVTVVRTMPHPPPPEPFSLEQLQMVIPGEAQTEMVVAMVRTRLAGPPPGSAAAPGVAAPACSPPKTPHTWDSKQRKNAETIFRVGVAIGVPKRGEIVALATAMQESQLYNLGNLGSRNDHDSLGLFQQRPSMGWGSPAELTDPVYAATSFYLALQSVSGWKSMSVTAAAQSVQRSGFPRAYAKWEADATALTEQFLCSRL
jgi:hypothetical protein